jgi:hypothetical protein
MSAQNLYAGQWIKAQGTNMTYSAGATSSHAVLHAIVVNSHSSGVFRLANGTATSFTYVTGSYSPATGSSILDFKELEFTNGILVQMTGTMNFNVIYNDLI